MKKYLCLLVFCFIDSVVLTAQNSYNVELLKNCSLTITGSTNISSFKLVQNGEKLIRNKISVSTSSTQNKINISQNQLLVPAKNFSSNNAMALKDFSKLIKSDLYPNLLIQIINLDVAPTTDKSQSYNATALVSITITGKIKNYAIPICINTNGNSFTIDGSKKLNITDFGLETKDKMMGLLKVSDWIDINFHIICKISSDETVAIAK